MGADELKSLSCVGGSGLERHLSKRSENRVFGGVCVEVELVVNVGGKCHQPDLKDNDGQSSFP